MDRKIIKASVKSTIAFVIPWYSAESTGGAETLCRSLVQHLSKQGIVVEVLTTCVKEFRSDWNENFWKQGTYNEDGATIRRFKVRKRNGALFDAVNAKLMAGTTVSPREEKVFMQEMIRSEALVQYLQKHQDEYRAIVPIPYMFGTTFDVLTIAPEKTYMIPCLHDEAYAYMSILKEPFRNIQGHFFNTHSEQTLAKAIFNLPDEKCSVMGIGVDPVSGVSAEFRKRYKVPGEYLLYVGRKDAGKNIYLLVEYFDRFIRETKEDIKLILMGSGRIELPETTQEHIWDLGFVSAQEKYDALVDALALCLPSKFESFSISIMESWLSRRPVLVHEACAVTREHVLSSQGGLTFRSYEEFREALIFLLNNKKVAAQMGENGEQYVLRNFTHATVTKRYVDALTR